MQPRARRPAHALCGFRTQNLGDDLQALTVAMLAPYTTTLIRRERISRRQLNEPHAMVMNYWFMSKGFRWPPHSSIEPIFHGFCVGRDEMMRYRWPAYLAEHQPIGCRDMMTVARLAEKNIGAYWSGCITMFLGRLVEPVPQKKRTGVLFVDLPPEAEQLVPADLRERAERISNYCPIDIIDDPLARWARIAENCDRLRHAEFVVTPRLHAALPSAGFGTPVVLVLRDRPKDLRRYGGYDSFLPVLIHNDGKPKNQISWNDVAPAVIPTPLVEHYETLKTRLRGALGGLNETIAPAVATRNRFLFENPGLGARPGLIRFDLGISSVVRSPLRWSDQAIELTIDGFAGFDRFDVPVEVQGYKARAWTPVGRLCDFAVKPNTR